MLYFDMQSFSYRLTLLTIILVFNAGCSSLTTDWPEMKAWTITSQNMTGWMMGKPPQGSGAIAGYIECKQYDDNNKSFRNQDGFSINTRLHKENSFIPINLSSHTQKGYFLWVVVPGKYSIESLYLDFNLYPSSGYINISKSAGIIEIKPNEVLYLGHFNLTIEDGLNCGYKNGSLCLKLQSGSNLEDLKQHFVQYGYDDVFIFTPKLIKLERAFETINNNLKERLVINKKDGSIAGFDDLYKHVDKSKSIGQIKDHPWGSLTSEITPQQTFDLLGEPTNVTTEKNEKEDLETWHYIDGSVTFRDGLLDIWRVIKPTEQYEKK